MRFAAAAVAAAKSSRSEQGMYFLKVPQLELRKSLQAVPEAKSKRELYQKNNPGRDMCNIVRKTDVMDCANLSMRPRHQLLT